jgi:hypothetical protein
MEHKYQWYIMCWNSSCSSSSLPADPGILSQEVCLNHGPQMRSFQADHENLRESTRQTLDTPEKNNV